MKRIGVFAALALCALPARGEVQLSTSALHVLTSINELPTKQDLELAFSPLPALEGLRSIIDDADPNADLALQLRAIRALPQFCSPNCQADEAHTLLLEVVSGFNISQGPKAILRVRAAIEALGVTKVADDLQVLQVFLGSSSRDIRATTAHALRNLCNTEAIAPLRARLDAPEPVAQVRLAISAALRDLNTCSGS